MECSMAKRMKLDSSVSNDCSDSINGEPPVNDVINKVQRDESQTCPMTKRMKLDDDECQNPYASPVNEENESIEQKLRQFDVLDEVDGDESDSDGSGGETQTHSISIEKKMLHFIIFIHHCRLSIQLFGHR